MRIEWQRSAGELVFNHTTIQCLCSVRNEINQRRSQTEKAVYSELKDGSHGVPYMPRLFPKGLWRVLSILPKTSDYERPFFISTDAHQLVEEWSITSAGTYKEKTGNLVEDYGYGLHCSTSNTTLGCGKIVRMLDLDLLIAAINHAWEKGAVVELEVI